MECRSIRFSRHAFERMFERAVSPGAVGRILAQGETIAYYPEDRPYPSTFLLGYDEAGPIHVVAARDMATGICYVITVYRPDPALWSADFRTRRRR